MHRTYGYSTPERQRGATLVIALLILVLIMMIGITAISTSNTQFKLAGNLQFEDSAMNNTETAITTAENWLSTASNLNDPGFTPAGPARAELLPLLLPAARPAARDTLPFTMTWDNTNSVSVAANPAERYFIEQMSKDSRLAGSGLTPPRQSAVCNQVNTYLISARGASARGATKFVQSYYSVLSCPPA